MYEFLLPSMSLLIHSHFDTKLGVYNSSWKKMGLKKVFPNLRSNFGGSRSLRFGVFLRLRGSDVFKS